MAQTTSIEWTESTWNPVTGCRKVSAGCDHCYAATLAKRLKAMGSPRYQVDGPGGVGFGVTLHDDLLDAPRRWRRPRRIFVNSMSDLFHVEVPESFIIEVFRTMRDCPQHVFQVLTKRASRMARTIPRILETLGEDAPLPNVWLGTSVENADVLSRINALRRVPAAVRFLSCEPLIGPLGNVDLSAIDWVIAGGESGPGHRRMDRNWVDDLRGRCLEAEVAFFFKQWGGRTPRAGGRILDGRTWDEMPMPRPTALA